MTIRLIAPLAIALTGLLACNAGKQQSQCEALCDWATQCNDEERPDYVDEAAMYEACKADVAAIDGTCADAEGDKGLNPADSELLTKCTDSINEKATDGECGGFTGSIDDISKGATTTECAGYAKDDSQAAFEGARDSTTETGEQLCDRTYETFCFQLESCISDEIGAENLQTAVDNGATAPSEMCLNNLSTQVTTCKAGEYNAGESVTDPNAQREFARECLHDWSQVTCEELLGGNVPAFCAGAFEDPTVIGGVMLDVAGEYTGDGG